MLLNQKLFVLALLTLSPLSAFGDLPAASLGPSKPIQVTFTYPTDLHFKDFSLVPSFGCWTTTPDSAGEADTQFSQAPMSLRVLSSSATGNMMSAIYQVENQATAQAPAQPAGFSISGCSVGIAIRFRLDGQNDPREPNGEPAFDQIISSLGSARSNSGFTDLTKIFETSLEGHYTLAMQYGGEVYDAELGHRVPYCKLTLSKESSSGLVEIGQALSFRRLNCSR